MAKKKDGWVVEVNAEGQIHLTYNGGIRNPNKLTIKPVQNWLQALAILKNPGIYYYTDFLAKERLARG